jgi:hypothetical protein
MLREGTCVFSASVVAQSRTAADVGRVADFAESGAMTAPLGTALPGATSCSGTSKSGARTGGADRPSGRFIPMPTTTAAPMTATSSTIGPAHRRARPRRGLRGGSSNVVGEVLG